MRRTFTLPEGYRKIGSIHSDHPVRYPLLIPLISALLASEILLMPLFFGVSITAFAAVTLFDVLLWNGTMAVTMLTFHVIHTLIGRLCGAKRTRFLANNGGYMSRGMYAFTTMLPDAVIVALLLTARSFVPDRGLTAICFSLVSFSVCVLFDVCVTIRVLRTPSRTLVKANGTRITLYAPL